jgi:hypothetical protein
MMNGSASIRRRMAGVSILAAAFTVLFGVIVGVAADRAQADRIEVLADLHQPCSSVLPADELRVVRDLLAEITRKDGIIVAEQTALHGSELSAWVGDFSVPFEETGAVSQDYLAKNRHARCMPEIRGDGVALRVLGHRVRHHLPKGSFWTRFRRENGEDADFYTVSRVGFSDDRSQAMLAVGRHCGTLCGHGDLVFAKWNGTRWTIERRRQIWIS